MRLSLLDHEEHQRKEAEEKRKQEASATATAAAAATGSMIQGGDGPAGPGPSTLEGRQSLLDSSSSSNFSSASSILGSASPSIPTHTKVGSQDSLTPSKKSWSFSRCRTPPPPSSNAGPPAALLTATTSNSRERWVSRSLTPEPVDVNGSSASSQPSRARRVSLDNSMPMITLNNDKAINPHVLNENSTIKPSTPFSNVDNSLDHQAPSASQITTSTSTSVNGLGSGSSSHGHLPSLPRLPSLDFEANDDSSKVHPY